VDKIALLIVCGIAILAAIGYAEIMIVGAPATGPTDGIASLPPRGSTVR
jgi:hypothetical protein